MTPAPTTIRVDVEVTNPGQFFACCGLLELADRLWPGAEGYFEDAHFSLLGTRGLPDLIDRLHKANLTQLDRSDDRSSPIVIDEPFRLRLDWWKDDRAGGSDLKVWAGSMEGVRIARAMQHALRDSRFGQADLFNIGMVVYDPNHSRQKVEPFYFDCRRAQNAHSRDVGFSANDLGLTTTAFPAVELLCLVGLQRCRPLPTDRARVLDYYTWAKPISAPLAPAAVAGYLPGVGARGYRFENMYRTGQRKHKAFSAASPLPHGV